MLPVLRSAEPDFNPLATPEVGAHGMWILSPTLLELTLVTAKQTGFLSSQSWDFADDRLPDPGRFDVKAAGAPIPIAKVGFRRRPIYAPLKKRDLRIGNSLFLELVRPIPEGATVTLTDTDAKPVAESKAVFQPSRWSPVLHVSPLGYAPDLPKQAFAGYTLGDLGEMPIPADAGFDLIDEATGKSVFHGLLQRRPDSGFSFSSYQEVYEADFSAVQTPGTYRLSVSGLGRSYPFRIDPGVPAAFARTYALGMYHQRCGTDNALPFTRFTHKKCHVDAAEVPTTKFAATQKFLAAFTGSNGKKDDDQKAPVLKGVEFSLYPYVNTGKVDVAGGHHDAGDYSKYTINSAQLVHHLVFAADAFAGVAELDNLGIPESGDGKSDILQEAKLEADFLARMQDADGGFYFLVYPRDRKYEDDVLPDDGYPQVVFPKNTSATAAATAALAQAATSPTFKKQFPEAAALYLEKAKRGWAFLEKAWAKYGREGAYQKITHYGDFNGDDDEVAWVAAEMYLATGDPKIHQFLIEEFDPTSKETWKWNWWSLFEAYGCAVRSYAFAERTGRIARDKLDPILFDKCNKEILARAHDCVRDANNTAYNMSFPRESKRHRKAAYFFPSDTAFDITAAHQIDPRPEFVQAALGNLNYEAGGNPLNLGFVTGVGWKRQHEIVHQYAQNDSRDLPPSGLPISAVQSGFAYVHTYKKELGQWNWPKDGGKDKPYPFYDRWGDSFNTTTEFTVQQLSRSLASAAYWMARTPLKTQPWKSSAARIVEADGGYRLEVEGLDSKDAFIVWEADGQQPAAGPVFKPARGASWIEAEALWPDGRRVFARREF